MDFKLECERKYIEMLEDVAKNNYQPPTLKKVERLIHLCYKDIEKCDRYLRDPVFMDVRYGEKAFQ